MYIPMVGKTILYEGPHYKYPELLYFVTMFPREGYSVKPDGYIFRFGHHAVYPSYELYKKYPDDHFSAWAEWEALTMADVKSVVNSED